MKTIPIAVTVSAFFTVGSAFAQNSLVKEGDYYALGKTVVQQPSTQELNEAKEGDYYAPYKTIVQQPSAWESNQAKEGDYYTPTQK